jgi:hypothetical protein
MNGTTSRMDKDESFKTIAALAGSIVSRRDSKHELTAIPIWDSQQLPAVFVRETDRDIPDRVVSWYEGSERRPVLQRDLTANERGALVRRQRDLMVALAASGRRDDRCAAAVTMMLSGFPAMNRYDDETSVALTNCYLDVVREKPPWAIIEACRRVRSNHAGLNPAFCPSEPEFSFVVQRLVEPYQRMLRKVDDIIGAVAQVEPPKLSREEIEAKLGRKLGTPTSADKGYTARVEADLADVEADLADRKVAKLAKVRISASHQAEASASAAPPAGRWTLT